jgi:hypothetical protein
MRVALYKSDAKTMGDAVCIGSLMLDNLKSLSKGEPSIQMIISSSADGTITADVLDPDNPGEGHAQHVTISLSALEEGGQIDDISDFELESGAPPAGLYEEPLFTGETKKKKTSPLGPILIVILILALAGAAYWYFFIYTKKTASAHKPPEAAQLTTAINKPAAKKPVPQPASVVPSPGGLLSLKNQDLRERPMPPVSSYKAPRRIPRRGLVYRVRWGDTLWDISKTFYRTPWLYHHIARHNRIRDPDHLEPGIMLRIPPKGR